MKSFKELSLLIFTFMLLIAIRADSQTMSEYASSPPFLPGTVKPNVMILFSNDHTNFYKGYNDSTAPNTYNNALSYYGYLDPDKCYSYTSSNRFEPINTATGHDCSASTGRWSGNFLNWVSMSHADFVRKATTGGKRSVDAVSGVVLERADIPTDGHQWVKTYSGADINKYTPYAVSYTFCNEGIVLKTKSGTGGSCSGGGVDTMNVRIKVCVAGMLESNCTYYSTGGGYFPEGLLQKYKDDMRFGLMTYTKDSYTDQGGVVRVNIGDISQEINSNGTVNSGLTGGSITAFINGFSPKGWDPVGEMYYEAIRYFKAQTSTTNYRCGKSPLTPLTDDNFPIFCSQASSAQSRWTDPIQYACQKNFIIIINDEYPSRDSDSLPGSYWPPSPPLSDPAINVETLTKSVGDMEGITGTSRTVGNTDTVADGSCTSKTITNLGRARGICPNEPTADGSFYIAGASYYAHTTDLRSDFSGTQTITTFGIAFRASPTAYQIPPPPMNQLWLASKYGGFNDKNCDGLVSSTDEWDAYNNSTGAGGADGIPDTFQYAEGGSDFETAMNRVFNQILEQTASGTSVSVLSTSASGAGNIYQAYFEPTHTIIDATGTRELTWLGHLNQLGIDASGNIKDKNNNTITYQFNAASGCNAGQTVVVTGSTQTPLKEWTNYYWDAGAKLLTQTSRTIKTFVDADNDGAVDSGEYIDFVDTNKTALRPYLRAATDTESENIINYIRGSSITGYRDRTYSGTNQYKLSDIIYSTPTVVSSPAENYGVIYGDKTYSSFFDSNKSRSTVVYIGANDGMLHAFNSTTGEELWTFIPQNLLPHLKWLTDTSYSHVYYVDLRAKVTDINFGDSTTPNWKTVLIGGMRLGGGQISVTDTFGTRNFQSSYFALDITNPTSPNLLWEFTLSDASLGFTTSYPTIAKVGNKWFVIIGSGSKSAYVPDYTGASTQTGKIFVLDARNTTGAWTLNSTYWKFDTSVSNGFMGDPLTVDIDFKNTNAVSGDSTSYNSYNTEVVYIGMTYKMTSAPTWRGKLYRLVLNGNVNPANWVLSTLFDGNGLSSATPITISPVATKDELDNLWVYFGTGRFYSQDDKSTTTKHAFFGIRDSYWAEAESKWKPCWNGSSWSSSEAECTTGTITAISSLYNSGDVAYVVKEGSTSSTVSSTTWGNIAWDTFVTNVSASSTIRGWYTELAAGAAGVGAERIITKPTVIGGTVLFTSFIPQTDVCSYGGTSNLYSLYYKTGTAYKESTIGTTITEPGAGGQTTVLKSTSLGYGMASSPAVHIGQEEGGTAKVFVQTSTGEIREISYQLTLPKSGVISWKEL